MDKLTQWLFIFPVWSDWRDSIHIVLYMDRPNCGQLWRPLVSNLLHPVTVDAKHFTDKAFCGLCNLCGLTLMSGFFYIQVWAWIHWWFLRIHQYTGPHSRGRFELMLLCNLKLLLDRHFVNSDKAKSPPLISHTPCWKTLRCPWRSRFEVHIILLPFCVNECLQLFPIVLFNWGAFLFCGFDPAREIREIYGSQQNKGCIIDSQKDAFSLRPR